MEELISLIDNYNTITSNFWFINLIVTSLDEDSEVIDDVRKKVFDYFYDFKSINQVEIVHLFSELEIETEKLYRLINYYSIAVDLYNKYQINSLNELCLTILEKWEENKGYDDSIIKNILLIETSKRKTFPTSEYSLLKIYRDMVSNDMIKNPNLVIGSSSEMLYTLLPNDSSCYEYNLKILSMPNIKWNIMRNGMNPLKDICTDYEKSSTIEEKKYYHDAIISAIKGSCSLFNNVFYWHQNNEGKFYALNYDILTDMNGNFLDEIHELLLTDEVFNHQLELYTEKNDEADRIIEKLQEIRNKRQLIKK